MLSFLRNSLIYLLVGLILSSGKVVDFVKIPRLFEHYKLHQSSQNDLNLIDFLAMHYWGDDANPSDDDLDKQLPFNDFSNSFEIPMINDDYNSFGSVEISFIQISPREQSFTIYADNYSFNYLSCIIQPPEFI